MPLRDDLLNPIPGANPSGESLRYAPVYDQIKEARREDADVPQGEWQSAVKKADWPLVIKLCSESLAKKTKDLQIAAWLTEAALRREGFAGLRQGLDLVRGLLENFWDTLYPEIEDGDLELRAAPVEWVGSRLEEPLRRVPLTRSGLDWLKYKESRAVGYEQPDNEQKAAARAQAISEGKISAEEFDSAFNETPKTFYVEAMEGLDGCLASLEELGRLCDDKFGDYSPNLTGLRKNLEEVKQVVHVLLAKKRQQEPDEEQPPAAEEELERAAAQAAAYQEPEPQPAAFAAAAPARAPARPKSLAAEPVDREDAIARVLAAGRWLRQNEPSNPAGYMVARALRWGELRADNSLLDAPPSEVRQEIKRLNAAGEYEAALAAAEDAAGMPWGRAWLDVHRYSAQLCSQLGNEAVAAAIRSGLRALLADLPDLASATLADDTPAANAETRAWIAEQVAPPAAAQPEALYAPAPSEPEPEPEAEQAGERLPDVYETALEAARNGNVGDAIAMLRREAVQAASGRTRFQRMVQLAQICLGAGHSAVAYPILGSLAEEIERRKLEEWESPETVAHALCLLYRAMRSVDAAPEDQLRIYHAVCRLDPVQALALPR